MTRIVQAALLGIAVIVLGLMVARPAAAGNIVDNGGFEDGFSSWTHNPSSSFPWSLSGFAHSGARSVDTGCIGAPCITLAPSPGAIPERGPPEARLTSDPVALCSV